MYPYFKKTIHSSFKKTTPIFLNEIIELFPEYSRAYIFKEIKFAEMREDLVKFSPGVYYIPEQTRFGRSTIVAEMVINKKYIEDKNEIFGVYSGIKLLNMFLLTTQVPNIVELTSNNETTRKRAIELDGMHFILKASRFQITKENYQYYTILELFTLIKPYEQIDDYALQQINNYMDKTKVDKEQLLKLSVFFPNRTIKNMIRNGIL